MIKNYPTLFDFMAFSYINRHEQDFSSYYYNPVVATAINDSVSFAATELLPTSTDFTRNDNWVFPLFHAVEMLHWTQNRFTPYSHALEARIQFVASNYKKVKIM